MIDHVYACISGVTIGLMVLATVSLSPMLAVEDAPRTAPPATPEHDVVENYHGKQVHDPYRWLEETGAPAVEHWIGTEHATSTSHNLWIRYNYIKKEYKK